MGTRTNLLCCAILATVAASCGPAQQDGKDLDQPESIAPILEEIADIGLVSTNEPSIAVNPLNPANIAVAVIGQIQVSVDGGQHFTPPQSGGFPSPIVGLGDSVVTFDGSGNLYWALLSNTPQDQWVLKVNPTTGVTVPGSAVNVAVAAGDPSGKSDKGWIVADRFPTSPCFNTLYMTWAGPLGFEFSRLPPGPGSTWSPAIAISAPPGPTETIRMHVPAVGADGAVYVAYRYGIRNGTFDENTDGTTGKIIIKRSDTCGSSFLVGNQADAFPSGTADLSFNFQFLCTAVDGTGKCTAGTPNIPRKLFRNPNMMLGSAQPVILPDPTTAANIMVIASDDPTNTSHGSGVDDAGVAMNRSTNKAANWSNPVFVDGGTGTSLQLMPSGAVDLNSRCTAISYYDNRSGVLNAQGNTMLDFYVRGSPDGGSTWNGDVRINDTQFDPNLSPQPYAPPNPLPAGWVNTLRIGEYNGLALAHGVAHAVFANIDPSSGNQRTFYDNIRVCPDTKLPPVTGHVAAIRQSSNTTALFSVGQDGALYRRWFSVSTGTWNGPQAITATGFIPPGAPLAALMATSTEVNVFFVANSGAMYYAKSVNEGAWTLTSMTATGFAIAGAHVGTGFQNGTQYDAFVIDVNGTLQTFVRQTIGSTWSANVPLVNGFAPSGAPFAVTNHPGANQLDVFAVASNGAVVGTFVQGLGFWTLPLAATLAGASSPNAHVAAAFQGTSQIDIFYPSPSGILNLFWYINNSAPFGPAALTGSGVMPFNGQLTAYAFNTNQVDLFFANFNGAVQQMYVLGAGAWNGPFSLTINRDVQPGTGTAVATQGSSTGLFSVGNLWLLDSTSTTGTSWNNALPILP